MRQALPNMRTFARLFGGAFLLHAVWEHAHLVLYTCAFKPYLEMAPMMWQAVAGDALFTVLIFLFCSMVYKQADWFRCDRVWLPVLLGALLAVGVEWHAVFIAHRWAYNDWMPTLFGIGLTPVLQMMLLPSLVFWWEQS